jgi:hypothetical protein
MPISRVTTHTTELLGKGDLDYLVAERLGHEVATMLNI